MVECVILDVDGTLVDSVDLHARAWQRAFEHFGYEVDFETVRLQIGKGADQLIPEFVKGPELESVYESLDTYRSELFKKEYLKQVKGFPNVREFVKQLLDDGKKVVLASSAKGDELAHYKQVCGIDDLIQNETSQDAVEKSKPHPDIFEEALTKLGNPAPNACVVIGDSPYDAIAARNAHVRAIGLRCGGFPEDVLWRGGFVALYADVSELLEAYRVNGDAVFEGGVARVEAMQEAP